MTSQRHLNDKMATLESDGQAALREQTEAHGRYRELLAQANIDVDRLAPHDERPAVFGIADPALRREAIAQRRRLHALDLAAEGRDVEEAKLRLLMAHHLADTWYLKPGLLAVVLFVAAFFLDARLGIPASLGGAAAMTATLLLGLHFRDVSLATRAVAVRDAEHALADEQASHERLRLSEPFSLREEQAGLPV